MSVELITQNINYQYDKENVSERRISDMNATCNFMSYKMDKLYNSSYKLGNLQNYSTNPNYSGVTPSVQKILEQINKPSDITEEHGMYISELSPYKVIQIIQKIISTKPDKPTQVQFVEELFIKMGKNIYDTFRYILDSLQYNSCFINFVSSFSGGTPGVQNIFEFYYINMVELLSLFLEYKPYFSNRYRFGTMAKIHKMAVKYTKPNMTTSQVANSISLYHRIMDGKKKLRQINVDIFNIESVPSEYRNISTLIINIEGLDLSHTTFTVLKEQYTKLKTLTLIFKSVSQILLDETTKINTVESLTIEGAFVMEEGKTIEELIRNFPNLKILYLLKVVAPASFFNITKNIYTIRELTIESCNIPHTNFVNKLDYLKNFELVNNSIDIDLSLINFTYDTIILESLTLKTLIVGKVTKINILKLVAVKVNKLEIKNEIENLQLYHCDFSENTYDFKSLNLKKLTIKYCNINQSNNDFYQNILESNKRKLKKITIRDSNFEDAEEINIDATPKKIEKLLDRIKTFLSQSNA